MRLHRLISLLSVIAYLAIAAPVLAVLDFAASAIKPYLPAFQPDAETALSLDRLARPTRWLSTLRSRFRAFMDRNRHHDLFGADHFGFWQTAG